MRTSVDPDRYHVTIHPSAYFPCDDPARDRVKFAPDAKAKWAKHDIEGRQVAALVLWQ